MGICIGRCKRSELYSFSKNKSRQLASYDESPRSIGRHLREVGSFFTTIHMYWNDLVLSKRAPRDLEISMATFKYRLQGASNLPKVSRSSCWSSLMEVSIKDRSRSLGFGSIRPCRELLACSFCFSIQRC
jgi:hypothetical protein